MTSRFIMGGSDESELIAGGGMRVYRVLVNNVAQPLDSETHIHLSASLTCAHARITCGFLFPTQVQIFGNITRSSCTCLP